MMEIAQNIDVRVIFGIVIDPINHVSDMLSSASGLQFDQIRLLFILFLHIFISIGFRYIRGTFKRSMFNIVIGLLTSFCLYGNQTVMVFFVQIPLYCVLIWKQSKTAIFVFVGGFGFLSLYHIKRMYEDYGGYKMDLTLLLMQQLVKITYTAWSIKDKNSDITKIPIPAQERLISRIPSFLDFFSYLFGFIGVPGPATDLYDYLNFIDEKDNYKDIQLNMKGIFKTIGTMVLFAVVYSGIEYYIPESFVYSETLANLGFISMIIIMVLWGLRMRAKYYIVWYLAQITLDVSGISYNDETGELDRWEGNNGIKVETTPYPKKKIANWNLGIQRWLKSTFYDRFVGKLGKTHAAALTFLLSAFWHGFYPCYYFGFAIMHFCNEIQKVLYKNSDLLQGKEGTYRYTATKLFFIVFFLFYTNCSGGAFASITYGQQWKFQTNTYFSILVPPIVFYFLQHYVRRTKKRRSVKQE